MIQLERYFENIFDKKEITPMRLFTFARYNLVALKGNNPGGIYDTIIAATETVLGNYHKEITETGVNRGRKAGGTLGKKQARKDFIDFLARREGLVRSILGRKSPEYKEFFPRGVNAFRHATDADFSTMAKVAVEVATKYEAQLGSDFKNELAARQTAFANVYTSALGNKGEYGMGKAQLGIQKNVLQHQLLTNIFTVAAHNPGKPETAAVYFDQHLLFPAKKHHLYKGKVEAGETKQVCTFKYSEGKRFHIMVNGVEPLQFQMSLRGTAAGRLVTVKPKEKFNEPFSYFSSAGDTLLAINPSGTRARYMVWEIA